jgi:hypothetical protein
MSYKKKSLIIDELVELGYDRDEIKKGTRSQLMQLKKDHFGEDPVENQENQNDEMDSSKPSMSDPEWTDYVLGHFVDSELKDGMPTCDGLRRVFRLLIGRISTVQMTVIKPPTSQDPSATVMCTLSYNGHCSSCRDRSGGKISDVFDVNQENTPWPYNKTPVASAATKAEARVLRKALGLSRVYSSEEIQEGVDAVHSLSESVSDDNKPMADSAKTAILTMTQRLGIDPSKLIKDLDFGESKSINDLSYKESHQVISKLNQFSRGEENGGEIIPDNLRMELVF